MQRFTLRESRGKKISRSFFFFLSLFFFLFFLARGEADITLFQPANSHSEEDGPESRAEVNPPSRNTGARGLLGAGKQEERTVGHTKGTRVSDFRHQRA